MANDRPDVIRTALDWLDTIGANTEIIINCLPDLTADGTLNFFDISAFLVAYQAQDPIADFNNDGVWNFFDVSAFLTAYNAGCP